MQDKTVHPNLDFAFSQLFSSQRLIHDVYMVSKIVVCCLPLAPTPGAVYGNPLMLHFASSNHHSFHWLRRMTAHQPESSIRGNSRLIHEAGPSCQLEPLVMQSYYTTPCSSYWLSRRISTLRQLYSSSQHRGVGTSCRRRHSSVIYQVFLGATATTNPTTLQQRYTNKSTLETDHTGHPTRNIGVACRNQRSPAARLRGCEAARLRGWPRPGPVGKGEGGGGRFLSLVSGLSLTSAPLQEHHQFGPLFGLLSISNFPW